MADFVRIMKDWRRMCAKNHTDCMRLCPICANPTCGELAEATDEDIRNAEYKVMAWAAEHLEPVYPTFREWLISIGVIDQMYTHSVIADKLAMTPIPADIAQKLGIEPKEG